MIDWFLALSVPWTTYIYTPRLAKVWYHLLTLSLNHYAMINSAGDLEGDSPTFDVEIVRDIDAITYSYTIEFPRCTSAFLV